MTTQAAAHLVAKGKLQEGDLGRAQLIAEERNAALNPLLVRLGPDSGHCWDSHFRTHCPPGNAYV